MKDEATFYIDTMSCETNRRENVTLEVARILDEYVMKNRVSVSDMNVALESYREMLAVNSVVIPAK